MKIVPFTLNEFDHIKSQVSDCHDTLDRIGSVIDGIRSRLSPVSETDPDPVDLKPTRFAVPIRGDYAVRLIIAEVLRVDAISLRQSAVVIYGSPLKNLYHDVVNELHKSQDIRFDKTSATSLKIGKTTLVWMPAGNKVCRGFTVSALYKTRDQEFDFIVDGPCLSTMRIEYGLGEVYSVYEN